MWPYAMSIGIISFYYRCAGILLDRTTGVGEIVIAEGDQIEESQSADPACTSYNISNLMQKVVATSLDTMTIFVTFVAIAMTMQTSSP